MISSVLEKKIHAETLKHLRNKYALVFNRNPTPEAKSLAEKEVAAINAGIRAIEKEIELQQ